MRSQNSFMARVPSLVIALACGALALFSCLLIRQFRTRLGHDQWSYLFEAQRFLSGAEIYGPRLAETNPPIIIWFSVLPVSLAKVMHISPGIALRALVVVLVVASVAWCLRILRRSPVAQNPLALALIGCAIVVTEFSIGGSDFGQREHLLIIFLLPYVLAVATGVTSTLSFGERCALGVSAGLAIWFKPHDVLVLVGLELFLALRSRTLRHLRAPEFLAAVVTSSIILAFIIVFTPLYGKETLPLLFDVYWALGTMNALALALSLKAYLALMLVLLAAWFFFRKSLHDPATSLALLVCSVFASFAYDLQHTDWRYHGYPHYAFLFVALSYFFIDLLAPYIDKFSSNPRLFRAAAVPILICVAILLCGAVVKHRKLFPPLGRNDLERFFAKYPPSTTVYVFSTGVPPLASAVGQNLTWGSRFAHLWMMPAILQNELGPLGPPAPFKRLSPAKLASLAALQRAESAEDINYWKPSVVLVEQCGAKHPCQGYNGENFSLLAWFLQDQDFAQAWSHYRQQPSTLEHFDVYKRVQ